MLLDPTAHAVLGDFEYKADLLRKQPRRANSLLIFCNQCISFMRKGSGRGGERERERRERERERLREG